MTEKPYATTAGQVRSNLKSLRQKYERTCLDKAADDEPVFVLRGQDYFAPDAIEHWAMMVRTKNAGVETPKVKRAMAEAREMRAWQKIHGSKVPD